jgi:hypothetical protein
MIKPVPMPPPAIAARLIITQGGTGESAFGWFAVPVGSVVLAVCVWLGCVVPVLVVEEVSELDG